MSSTPSSTDPKKTTPPAWSSYKDARQNPAAGKYPNYWAKKTRSGHAFLLDDSEGAEHVTLQHRSGSMLQMMPDGAVQFVSHNGQCNIIFGENRILITGAYDVVVHGGASLSVEGDYNMTVKNNMNLSVAKDINILAKNINQTVTGAIDTSAKSMTSKIEGSTSLTSHGTTTISSDGGLTLASTGDSVAIAASSTLGLKTGSGGILTETVGDMHMKITGKLVMEASGTTSIRGKTIYMDGSPNIRMNEGSAENAKGATVTFKKPTSPQEPPNPKPLF